MSKTFAEYGLSSEEFEGLVLEDPALFDSFVIRMGCLFVMGVNMHRCRIKAA